MGSLLPISVDKYYTILYDLPRRIQLYKPKIVVISGLLDQLYQDPYINIAEAERLVSQIVTALNKMRNILIGLTSRLADYGMEFPALSRIIEIRDKNNRSKMANATIAKEILHYRIL
jgi:hypothetical protein